MTLIADLFNLNIIKLYDKHLILFRDQTLSSCSLLTLMESTIIAAIRIIPWKASLQSMGTLVSASPFDIDPRIKVATKTPTRVPLPPASDIPASTQIVSILNSKPRPNSPCAKASWLAITTPPSPAVAPDIINV